MSEVKILNGFTLNPERQCRARGHVFVRDTLQPGAPPENRFIQEMSETCFRCGMGFSEANEDL